MGRSFSNITIKGQNQIKIADYLESLSRRAYVSPTINNFTVVFDEESEKDYTKLSYLATRLSENFGCLTLPIFIYDESVFCYELYKDGQLLDEYISKPDFHDSKLDPYPEGGDAEILCKVLNIKKATSIVRPILREPSTEKGYHFASDRHMKFVRALGLPLWSTGGYSDIEDEIMNELIFGEDEFSHEDDIPHMETVLSMLRKTFT